jgi:peptidyl-prolyl cis-trans isomerase SurA
LAIESGRQKRDKGLLCLGQESEKGEFITVFFSNLLALNLLSMFVIAKASGAQEMLIDRIVAVVDGEPILHSQIDFKVKNGPLVSVSDYPADKDAKDYDRALQDLINFELVMAKAREMEIEVSDGQVDGEISAFLQGKSLTKEGLMEFLKSQGRDYEEYREDFRDQMIMRRFQGRVITPLVKITDKDIETFYLQQSGSSAELLEITLRQILIKLESGAPNTIIETKEKLAQEVFDKLEGGMDFKDAVRIYSDDLSSRDTGGLMKNIKLRDLAGQIRTEVEGLELKKFTTPIRTSLGFHIFFLENKVFAGSDEFKNQKQKLEFELRTRELTNQTKKWLADQRQKSKIEIVE